MTRTILFLTVAALAALIFVNPALAAPGDLDTTFDGDGKVLTSFGYSGKARAVAVQPDGKVVAAGSAINNPDGGFRDFAVTRYSPYGTLDRTFSQDGKAITSMSTFSEEIYDLAVQPDGKIVVVGFAEDAGTRAYKLALARYNADGTLDTSFGSSGKVTTSFGDDISGQALAIQSDGKIVVAAGSGGDFVIVRYNGDGSLDGGASDSTPGDTFGTGGKVTTHLGSPYDFASDLTLQPDGKIVAAGSAYPGNNQNFALARYNTDGTLDTDSDADPESSFDTDGKLTTDTGSIDEGAQGVVVQPDGKIAVAGSSYIGNGRDFTLIRYNADGSLDTTFDADGQVTTAIGSSDDEAQEIALQDDGKLVVTGLSYLNSGSVFAVARYGSEGSLDSTFSGDGKTTTTISGDDIASGLAVQSDNKIIAAGGSMSASNDRFALVRYYGNGDTVAPGPVASLEAAVQGAGVSLTWTNPTDEDFDATKILRSTTGYAASATDTVGQRQVYLGRGTSHTDVGLASGTYYYTAFAIDDSGNWSVAAQASAVVDATPPNTIMNTGPTHYVNKTFAAFTFSASEVGSSFQCKLDATAFAACDSPENYSALAQGWHTFRVKATDAAGNTDLTPATRSWFTDTVAPRGSVLINGGATTTSSRTVTLRLSATDTSPASGVGSVRFSNNGTTWTTWQTYASSKSWTLTSGAGSKTVYVQYRDRAGNVSPQARDTIKYAP